MTSKPLFRHRAALAAATILTPLAVALPTAAAAQQAIYPVAGDQGADPTLAGLAIPADAAQKGMWSRKAAWPIIAIHSSVLPDGRVLTFGAPPGVRDVQDGRQLVFWDPRKGLGADAFQIMANAQNVDSFCATATLLSDGTLLTSGGASYSTGYSSRESMTLDWRTSAARRDYDLTAPRWYGTMTKLPDGRAIITGGGVPYAPGNPNRPDAMPDISSTPEVYTPGQGWRSMVGAYSTDAFGAKNTRWWYPRQWVSPAGTLFGISTEKMWEMGLAGNGSIRTLRDFKTAPNPTTRPNTGPTSTAVMYDAGKILQVGGNGYYNGWQSASSAAATVIDITGIGAGRVAVTETAPMANPRQWPNAVVLPDGRVLVTGGSRFADNDGASAVYAAETWNPATGRWTTGAAAATYRGYHATASLLPSGAVLTAGGGAPGPQNNLDAEIYYPAYLFAASGGGSVLAARPRIVSLSSAVGGYGQSIDLQTGTGDDVREVSLIAVSSVTHSFDSNQRRMTLAFTRTANGIKVSMPASANLAPPGYYLLSTVNAAGVPSVGSMIAIGAAAPPSTATPTTPPTPPTNPVPTPPVAGAPIGHDAQTTLGVANTAGDLWVSQMGATWRKLPGKGTELAVIADNRYYATGPDRNVFRWNGAAWTQVGRNVLSLSAAADGTVGVVSTDRSVWIKVAEDAQENWRRVPAVVATKIAVMKRGSYYLIAPDNLLWRVGDAGAPAVVGRAVRDVAVSADGTITVVSTDGTVWRKVGDTNEERWTQMPFNAAKIATPDANRAVYADAAGAVFRR